eukprot:scaffold22577_cov122-Cylindrotheca_fusiformis.AAC.22
MAGGKHSSRTFVKRTLVGDPGITYKYLGLRLFAHPWSGPGSLPMMKSIKEINKWMVEMTKTYPNHGSCAYNMTLINYMPPTSHSQVGFKDEAMYGMGKVSVSWHADSSLKENSSIAVFHCLPTQRAAPWDWRIALRPSPDSGKRENDALPVAVSTSDGDAYFLLGTFNQNYQHCVLAESLTSLTYVETLAGSSAHRISSTHRVAVTDHETFEYIMKRVKNAVKRFRLQFEKSRVFDMDARVIAFCQKVLTEVEMDWIAQYWLQGSEHNKLHTWWQKPMESLEAMWSLLEELTFRLYQCCSKDSCAVPDQVVAAFLDELKFRQKQRKLWDNRRNDKVYVKRVGEGSRPIARPKFEQRKDRLGKDLSLAIHELQVRRCQDESYHSKKEAARRKTN